MNAVCILGSPRANGNTQTIVTADLLLSLASMDIGYSCGCKACYSTGKCIQTDDIQRIVADMLDAQLVIVASPSYWGDVTGQMKVFIDRMGVRTKSWTKHTALNFVDTPADSSHPENV